MSENVKRWKCPNGHVLGLVERVTVRVGGRTGHVGRLMLFRQAIDAEADLLEAVDVIAAVEGTAMVTVMHWPWPVAVIGAMIIEGLGFGTVDTAMRMREWNKSRRKRFDVNAKRTVYLDPAAPTFYAMIILVVYLVVALALTICLIVVWVLSAPLRWLSGYFLKAGMELLHPVRLQKKVSSIWHPSSL